MKSIGYAVMILASCCLINGCGNGIEDGVKAQDSTVNALSLVNAVLKQSPKPSCMCIKAPCNCPTEPVKEEAQE